MVIDFAYPKTKFRNLSAAYSFVFFVSVAFAFGLRVSWLAEEVVLKLYWCMGFLNLSFSLSTADFFIKAEKFLRLLIDGNVCLHNDNHSNQIQCSQAQWSFCLDGSNCSVISRAKRFFSIALLTIGKDKMKERWNDCYLDWEHESSLFLSFQ